MFLFAFVIVLVYPVSYYLVVVVSFAVLAFFPLNESQIFWTGFLSVDSAGAVIPDVEAENKMYISFKFAFFHLEVSHHSNMYLVTSTTIIVLHHIFPHCP